MLQKLGGWQTAFVLLLGVLTGAVITRHYASDDGIITLRYSYNLIHGHGPNWNVSGPRVEGYTSGLFMFLSALLGFVRVDLLVAAKVMGSLFLLGAAWVVACTIRIRTQSTAHALAGGLAIAWSPVMWLQAGLALETTLFGMLSAALIATLLLRPRQSPWLLPLLALLISLTRPEGALIAVGALVVSLIFDGDRRSRLIRYAVIYIIPLALYITWRWSYYGYPLPNTVYVKGGQTDLHHAIQWLHANITILLPLALALVYAAWRKYVDLRSSLALALPLLAVLPYSKSDLITDFFHRFLSLQWPAIVLVGVVVFHSLQTRLERVILVLATALMGLVGGIIPSRSLDVLMAVVMLLVALGCIAPRATPSVLVFGLVTITTAWSLVSIKPELLYAGRALQPVYGSFGRSLAQSPHTMKIAVGDTGAMPYYSHWQVMDIAKLNDARTTHGANPRAELLAFDPDLVLLYTDSQGQVLPTQKGYLDISGLDGRYTRQGLLHLWSSKTQNYGLAVYSKAGSAQDAAIAQRALAAVATDVANWGHACGVATWSCAVKALLQ